jgi:hypothetical protein
VIHARSRLVGLIVLCVAPLVPAAAQSDPGWTITTKMSLTSDSAGPTPTEMKIEVTKDHMRVSLTGIAASGPAAGMYMIFDGTHGTATSVLPSTQVAADAVSSVMGIGANAGLAKLHALRQSTPKGFTLKWVGTSTTRSGNGKTAVSRGTTEVTEVAKSEIPSSWFTVPSDYRTTDVRNAAARMDSSLMAKAMSSEAAVEGFKRVCAPEFKQP